MGEELLLCPFCNGEARLLAAEAGTGTLPKSAREPYCTACGCSRGYYDTAASAIAAWNTRTALVTPTPDAPADPGAGEREGDLTAVGRYYIHQDGLWLASFDTPEDRDQALAAMRALSGVKDPEGAVRMARGALTNALGLIVEFGDLNGFRNLSNAELGRLVTSVAEQIADARAAFDPTTPRPRED